MSVPDTVRHGSAQVIFEEYPILGYNYRMTDIQASVGRVQLERMPDIIAARRRIGQRYGELLQAGLGVKAPFEPEFARSNWQGYCVRLPDYADQRTVMQNMLEAGIATRRGIMCAHREKPYLNPARAPLPHSEAAQDHCIVLPLYPQMTDAEQDQVLAALKRACAQ